jgi:hypothetical protein
MKTSNLALFVALVVAVVLGFVVSTRLLPPPGSIPSLPPLKPEEIAFFTTVKTLISFVNITLILWLLSVYITLYKEIKSRFTLGLILLMLVLFLYALSSNPLLHFYFGFYSRGLGPFTVIPDLFTAVALIVLVYLSNE